MRQSIYTIKVVYRYIYKQPTNPAQHLDALDNFYKSYNIRRYIFLLPNSASILPYILVIYIAGFYARYYNVYN